MATTAETIETIVIAGDNITAALLVWRRFQRPMPGIVERLYVLNPGLAAAGPSLPVGAAVRMPIPPPAKVDAVTPLRLWS
jgi:phage tail protein X